MNLKKCILTSLLFCFEFGAFSRSYAREIQLFCYSKNVTQDSKRFVEAIYLEDSEDALIIDGKFDHLLQEYIIDKADYEDIYQHCLAVTSGKLLVDLKAVSINNPHTSFLFSVGPMKWTPLSRPKIALYK